MDGIKAKLGKIAHDLGHSQIARHILLGFVAQLRLVVQHMVARLDFKKVTPARSLLGAANLAFTGIVGRDGRGPVAKVAIEFLQIVCRSLGGFERIKPLVRPPVLIQTILLPGIGHELPGSGGPGWRAHFASITAFHNGKVGQVFRHASRAEHALGIGKELLCPF